MKLSDYFNFEFPMMPYWNSAYGDHAPRMKYRGEYMSGHWYLKYVLNGNTPALVPKDSWLAPGRRYVKWILENDEEFTDHLYATFVAVIPFADRLEAMNYEDMKNGVVRSRNEFYDDYIRLWSPVIGFGYPLDMALDEYLREHPIDTHSLPVYGHSFIREEEIDLKKIANEADVAKKEEMLQEHAWRYSYVLSNYTGYHPATLEYFRNRLDAVRNKDFSPENIVPMAKPRNLSEWIGFATYIRDVRKRCNMTYNAMSDRYLRDECQRLGLAYEDAVFLLPEEFEIEKKKGVLRRFEGSRYMEVTNDGQKDIDKKVWDSLITEKEGEEVRGAIASRGKASGRVRIVLSRDDFHKMEPGDVLVTSMTRPDFAPVLHKCGAIVTNEGGVTCHAAIISREMKIPCIIATGSATKVLHDGDMVEVDAERGIVRIIKE